MSHLFQNDSSESTWRRWLSRKDCFGYILARPATPPGAEVGLDQPVKVLEPSSVVRVVGVHAGTVAMTEVMNWALVRAKMDRRESARR